MWKAVLAGLALLAVASVSATGPPNPCPVFTLSDGFATWEEQMNVEDNTIYK